ncbi:Diaminopimelate epimerase-like protein [Panus rudis PR-1116 ss-1]|nr:Diaminopimelate epimerase-like protein [Panus rudis PR-1116 ss-1]
MSQPRPSVPLVFFNAFSSEPFGGNPAAIVFLEEELPDATLLGIAKNLNQPIATFVLPSDTQVVDHSAKTYGVRWFTTVAEVPLCGHGTLAAAGAIFNLGMVPETVVALEFRTKSGVSLTAKRVEDRVEITLPAGIVDEVTGEEGERLKSIIRKALGDDVNVRFVGKGGRRYEHFMLAEIDESNNLGGRTVNTDAFRETGYITNVITSVSTNTPERFHSRMFAPVHGVHEDHVCGSAHCLLTPYWSRKLALEGEVIQAKQVSARGGDLKVIWHKPEKSVEGELGRVALRGETVLTVKGDLFL